MASTPEINRGADRQRSRPRGFVSRVGAAFIDGWRRVALSVAIGLAALWRIGKPRTWRSTVRREFVRHCWQVGIKALPTTLLTAAIVGMVLVFQVLYWRRDFGDVLGALNVNTLVLLMLVREIAPLLVGFIIIGRSATVMISELVELRAGGQIHMIDAQGIDVFDYLVAPRVAALAVCSFALSVVFVLVALLSGQVLGVVAGVQERGLFEFLVAATRLLTPTEYLLLPLKSLSIGVLIGVVACVTALRTAGAALTARELLPLGFMRAVVATFILSGAITAVVVV